MGKASVMATDFLEGDEWCALGKHQTKEMLKIDMVSLRTMDVSSGSLLGIPLPPIVSERKDIQCDCCVEVEQNMFAKFDKPQTTTLFDTESAHTTRFGRDISQAGEW